MIKILKTFHEAVEALDTAAFHASNKLILFMRQVEKSREEQEN